MIAYKEKEEINMTLHIAYSSDNNYVRHLGASMVSLFEHNRDSNHIVIHILDNGIGENSKEKINAIAENYNREIRYYDFNNIKEKLTIDVPDTIAISAYSRLFLSSTINEEVDKVIYLDSDSIVLGSFSDLWSQNVDNFYVAGVLDNATPNTKSKIGLEVDSPYINSGFLLINLKMWRKYNAERLMIDFILQHEGNVYHHDQGVINGVFANNIKILEPKYNVMTPFFDMSIEQLKKLCNVSSYYSQKEIDEAKEKPVFVHFTPAFSSRPWMENCKHPLKNSYLKFLNMTGWKGTSVEKDKRNYKVKLVEWMFFNIPFPIFNKIWKRL